MQTNSKIIWGKNNKTDYVIPIRDLTEMTIPETNFWNLGNLSPVKSMHIRIRVAQRLKRKSESSYKISNILWENAKGCMVIKMLALLIIDSLCGSGV